MIKKKKGKIKKKILEFFINFSFLNIKKGSHPIVPHLASKHSVINLFLCSN
jgi:hypothetical protein